MLQKLLNLSLLGCYLWLLSSCTLFEPIELRQGVISFQKGNKWFYEVRISDSSFTTPQFGLNVKQTYRYTNEVIGDTLIGSTRYAILQTKGLGTLTYSKYVRADAENVYFWIRGDFPPQKNEMIRLKYSSSLQRDSVAVFSDLRDIEILAKNAGGVEYKLNPTNITPFFAMLKVNQIIDSTIWGEAVKVVRLSPPTAILPLTVSISSRNETILFPQLDEQIGVSAIRYIYSSKFGLLESVMLKGARVSIFSNANAVEFKSIGEYYDAYKLVGAIIGDRKYGNTN